jgi:hypothetical protein
MQKIPSWEANSCTAGQYSLVFYGTQRFITMLTAVHHHRPLETADESSSHPNLLLHEDPF